MTETCSTRTPFRDASLVALASLVLCLAAQGALAAPASAPAESSRYEQERAKCLNGTSNQDRATCLKEAGAARDQAKKGGLNDGDASYGKNANARCDALTGDEQKDCRARMKGAGSVSGSVEGGGIVRETVTRQTTTVPVPASAASAH